MRLIKLYNTNRKPGSVEFNYLDCAIKERDGWQKIKNRALKELIELCVKNKKVIMLLREKKNTKLAVGNNILIKVLSVVKQNCCIKLLIKNQISPSNFYFILSDV